MSEHQRETAFLQQCIRYDETTEHQSLEQEITQLQRDERCVQRAVWLMAVLIALAVAGLGYPAILVESFPYNVPRFIMNLGCALGGAALTWLLVFVGLGMAYRRKLNQRREECRQLITRLLACRPGAPVTTAGARVVSATGIVGPTRWQPFEHASVEPQRNGPP